jgi:probable HAF family extracellular repeat protein
LPLNDLGQVIGQSQANNGRVIPTQKPFLWQNGNLSYFNNLDDLGGGYSKVFDINNSGQVVSRTLTSSRLYQGFLWQNGTKTDRENNGSDNSSVAVGINNSGQVVGWSYQAVVNDPGSPDGSYMVLIIWSYGKTANQRRNLNKLLLLNSRWELNIASGINNKGQIVGTGTFNGQNRAFLLTPVTVSN